jgi:hypothetical protein
MSLLVINHDCATPDRREALEVCEQILYRWRCPECGQRWKIAQEGGYSGRYDAERVGRARRSWRKQRARELGIE